MCVFNMCEKSKICYLFETDGVHFVIVIKNFFIKNSILSRYVN